MAFFAAANLCGHQNMATYHSLAHISTPLIIIIIIKIIIKIIIIVIIKMMMARDRRERSNGSNSRELIGLLPLQGQLYVVHDDDDGPFFLQGSSVHCT